jgi:signal transduction histidine kinase
MRSATMLAAKHSTDRPEGLTELSQMLERFNESSSKLELRYEALMQEVDQLRKQLAAKEEEIKRSERLSMLGETAAALAHEVRNPLGAITLFISMLKADLKDRPQSVNLVEEIEKSITSLNAVVSNVLHFAKNNTLHRGPMNVHSLVQEVVQHFISLYGTSAIFALNVSGNPFIVADAESLRQCLYNLFTNALQVTSYQGEIYVCVSDAGDEGAVQIVVSDNGPGIPPEIMPRIFEPFASGRREGTGLGLSIVKRIVEAHGGSIVARNSPGAEFSMSLPRCAK